MKSAWFIFFLIISNAEILNAGCREQILKLYQNLVSPFQLTFSPLERSFKKETKKLAKMFPNAQDTGTFFKLSDGVEVEVFKLTRPDLTPENPVTRLDILKSRAFQKFRPYFEKQFLNPKAKFIFIDIQSEFQSILERGPFKPKTPFFSATELNQYVEQCIKGFKAKWSELENTDTSDMPEAVDALSNQLISKILSRGTSEVQIIEVNQVRTQVLTPIFSEAEIDILRGLSLDQPNHLIINRWFFPGGYVIETAFYNGHNLRKRSRL
ncbi:MAG: hypothetical protein JWQ35_44 [Bacteriovoracaceae bacterium]|nr:hypothetical protein [Bacteriovoracaceae bacterium]